MPKTKTRTPAADWQTRYRAMLADIPDRARRAAARAPGQSIYLVYRPADGAQWGEIDVHTWPEGADRLCGWQLVTGERINAVPFEAIVTRFYEVLRRLPIIGTDA